LLILVSTIELWSKQISSEAEILEQKQIELAKSKCYQKVEDLLIESICEELAQISDGNNSQVNL